MASDMGNQGGVEGDGDGALDAKSGKMKPTKSLPTDRVSFENQLLILRAFAKASLAVERAAVSNSDVSRYASITPSSISNCNSFWNDAGLLIREGMKQRPIDAIFDYDQAVEWKTEQAASKLASALSVSWFGKAMLTKLAIKPTTIAEALQFLAQECRASLDYKDQLRMLLEYLQASGLVTIDGNTVTKTIGSAEDAQNEQAVQKRREVEKSPITPLHPELLRAAKRFSIPIPDKEDAVITLPDDLDAEDWAMVQAFLNTYVERWKKFAKASMPTVATGNTHGGPS